MQFSSIRNAVRVQLSTAAAASAILLGHLGVTCAAEATKGSVDGARIADAERDAANWLTYGRTYSEQRYSPLTRISADNANRLGLAWSADLDTNRGQ